MAKTLLKVFNVLADPARIDTGTGSDAVLEFWQSIYCIHTCVPCFYSYCKLFGVTLFELLCNG